MARAIHLLIEPGDARASAPVNTIFANLVVQSGDIRAVNLRDEGIDENVTEADVFTESIPEFNVESLNAVTSPVNVVWAPVLIGAVTLRLTGAGGGPFTVAADEFLRVRAQFSCPTNPAGLLWGVPPARRVAARIAHFPSGGALTPVPNSVKRRGNSDVTAARGVNAHFSLFYLLGPGTYDFIETQTQLEGGAGTYRVNFGSMHGTLFKRAA